MKNKISFNKSPKTKQPNMSAKITLSNIPSCKHCANIGLNSNHSLRDFRTKKVLCPILNNTVCRNCGKMGHTVSHCKTPLPVIPVKVEKKIPEKPAKKSSSKSTPKNIYDVLNDDDYFQTPEPIVKPVVAPVVVNTPIAGISYAEMARSAPFIPLASISVSAFPSSTTRKLWSDEVSSTISN
jgi:hypothetical protein